MLKYPDPGRLDQCFKLLERAALAGVPFPRKKTLPACSHYLIQELARLGKIRVMFQGANWRVCEILTGPHAGKKTKANPAGGKHWKIIGQPVQAGLQGAR